MERNRRKWITAECIRDCSSVKEKEMKESRMKRLRASERNEEVEEMVKREKKSEVK